MNKVDQFYSDNYNKMVKYVMNRKRGGDHLSLLEEDSMAVVHMTYIYHRTHMNRFIPGFVWNKLSQMRKDFLKADGIFSDMKDAYRHILDTEHPEDYEPVDKKYEWWEYGDIIRTEINNHPKRDLLHKHFILGSPIPRDNRTEESVAWRFKVYMVKKYGVNQ